MCACVFVWIPGLLIARALGSWPELKVMSDKVRSKAVSPARLYRGFMGRGEKLMRVFLASRSAAEWTDGRMDGWMDG